MKRKASKTKTISTHGKLDSPKFDAEAMYAALEGRVAALEKQAAYGQSEYLPDDPEALVTAVAKVKRGPKPKYRRENFLLARDLLVDMLESYWPEIELACTPVARPASLRNRLRTIALKANSQHQLNADHLLRNLQTLLSFMATDRFRGDPRQIANALAGVPAISYWRSLRLAQAESCQERIGQRAVKSYIRRKHPRLYRELESGVGLIHFTNTWRAYRTSDPNIRDYYARAIHHAWIAAEPNLG